MFSHSKPGKTYTEEQVGILIDQAIAYALAQAQTQPSPVEYDVAMLRQYALYQAMSFNVQIAPVKGAPLMEQVILDANKILEYLGHGLEITPSIAAYQGVLSATAEKAKQASAQPNGYV